MEAATLRTQSLEDVPANVSVITAAEIRKYGYRTLGEALASARGFYSTYDRIYHYIGVRGFSLPGDYNTRFLVMINGHPMTEIIYNSNGFFGDDFGLDMELVHRIEIIRGASSVLYGSNAIFANINIITKSPVDIGRMYASTQAGTFGEKKAMVATSAYLGKGANLLFSGSVFNNAGQSLYIPDYDTAETNHGLAQGTDGERGYHSFANVVWKDWSFTAYFNSRQKHSPVSWSDSIFADRGGYSIDSRNFVEASFTRDVGKGKIRWRGSFNSYGYFDRWDYQMDSYIQDSRSETWGKWISTQLNYDLPAGRFGELTVGIQGDVEVQNVMRYRTVAPQPHEFLRISEPDRSGAVFSQLQLPVSAHVTAYTGVRLNASGNYDIFLSPQAALVYRPSPKTTYKLTYGHPFRNPSVYEQYYADNVSVAASGGLRPEAGHIFEVSAERKLRPNLQVLLNAFYYDLDHMIQGILLANGLGQYANFGGRTSTGVEFELAGTLAHRLEIDGSLAVQRAVDVLTDAALANSPRQVSKLRANLPIFHNRFDWSGQLRTLAARQTLDLQSLSPVVLVDTTWTTRRLHRNFDVQLGIRNLLNRQYDDPADVMIPRVHQDGRSAFVRLFWHWE